MVYLDRLRMGQGLRSELAVRSFARPNRPVYFALIAKELRQLSAKPQDRYTGCPMPIPAGREPRCVISACTATPRTSFTSRLASDRLSPITSPGTDFD